MDDRASDIQAVGRSDERGEEILTPEPKNGDQRAEFRGARLVGCLEDANTPHWTNVMSSQVALADAVRRRLTLESPEGKPTGSTKVVSQLLWYVHVAGTWTNGTASWTASRR